MIFWKITRVFHKNYEKIVKSAKFVILTIAFFFIAAIIIFGSWHSKNLSANDFEKPFLILADGESETSFPVMDPSHWNPEPEDVKR